MAIYHFSAKIISRGRGQSALCAAAYRHGAEMMFEREGRIVAYTGKHEVVHTEFLIPDTAPHWVSELSSLSASQASEKFWNRVESHERRNDAQLAREIELALPKELSREQNIALLKEFLIEHYVSRGMIADVAYHDLEHNPHAHIMLSLRPLHEDGFSSSRVPVLSENGQPLRSAPSKSHPKGQIVYADIFGGDWTKKDALAGWRESWGQAVNYALAKAGFGQSIDHRTLEAQGIELAPSRHQGPNCRGMERRGLEAPRVVVDQELQVQNIARIAARPECVLEVITAQESVFDRRDMARALHRYVDDAAAFGSLLARIETCAELVPIAAASYNEAGQEIAAARYTTRAMLDLERAMLANARALAERGGEGIVELLCEQSFARSAANGLVLSDEQKAAVRYITGESQLALVVGRAGAGKSTMLRAAHQSWAAAGKRVFGAALAGKAVQGLQESSGITQARTLASWEARWARGIDRLQKGDVLVIDEAGMIGSRQLASFLGMARAQGVKLVLVGDPEQLQPIAAGAAYRAVAGAAGYVELTEVRRQKSAWMREATIALALGQVDKAFEAYGKHGAVHSYALKDHAIEDMARQWVADHVMGHEAFMLAHSRNEVAALNERARAMLVEGGHLGAAATYKVAGRQVIFAVRERVLFLQNDAGLNVKNGQFGTVVKARDGRLDIEIVDPDGAKRVVRAREQIYSALQHGYATTVHKSQGMTAARIHMLASRSWNSNLAYVGLTRHSERADIYYGRKSFAEMGGIARALARSGAKGISTDHEVSDLYARALEYGDRRGHFTPAAWAKKIGRLLAAQRAKLAAMAEALSAVLKRFDAMGLRSAPEARVQELAPLVPAVTAWAQTPEAVGAGAAMNSRQVARKVAEIEKAALRIWAEPKAIVQKLLPLGSLPDAQFAREMAALPTRVSELGALRRAGLLSRPKQPEAGDIRNLLGEIASYRKTVQAMTAKLAAAEQERRSVLAIAVPGLLPSARALVETLAGVRALHGDDALDSAVRAAAQSQPLELQEIARAGEAIARRFGRGNALSEADLAKKAALNGDDDRQQKALKIMLRDIKSIYDTHKSIKRRLHQEKTLRQEEHLNKRPRL